MEPSETAKVGVSAEAAAARLPKAGVRTCHEDAGNLSFRRI